MKTYDDAYQLVSDTINPVLDAGHADIDAIVEAFHARTGHYDFGAVPADLYWGLLAEGGPDGGDGR